MGAGQSSDLGWIAGVVTDDEAVPLAGVRVELRDTPLGTETDANGSFEIRNVLPAEYILSTLLIGYESTSVKVAVTAGAGTDVKVTLRPFVAVEPYYETFPFRGTMECVGHIVVGSGPCTYAYDVVYHAARDAGVNLSSYGVPREVLENHRFYYHFSYDRNHTGIVSEMIWTPTTTMADRLWFTLTCPEYGTTNVICPTYYADKEDVSPIRIEGWKVPKPAHPEEGRGWVMSSALLADGPALVLDQTFQMFNTVFYNTDPPAGFTVIPEGG